MRTTGIILAGGKSSRMGTNKALLKIGGKTVIERIASELSKAVSDIIVVTNWFEDYQFLGFPMIEDKWKGLGPLAGIHAGLTASRSDKNLVVACDMPFMSSELGGILLNHLKEHQAAVPEIAGQLHPLFAAYRKDVMNEAERSLAERRLKIRQFLKEINTSIIKASDLEKQGFQYKEAHFFNMNDPEEFEKALKMTFESPNS